MAHTYYQNLYHLIWSTKERRPLIPSESKQRIFEYLGGAFKTAGCIPLQVGGMSDHVHVLLGIPPKFAISEVIRDVKVCSTKWIGATLPDCKQFSWQEGFGSFTVSVSQKDSVYQYILRQEEHHKTRSFTDEFKEFLKIHDVQYDEKYLWL